MSAGSRAILEGLADCLPESATQVEATGDRTRVWLPKPDAADYRLYIDTSEHGGAFIGALPNGAPAHAFFWHLPLDYAPDDADAALAVLVEQARRLVLSRSRIIESGGLLLWRFRCEVEEGGEWKRVGGTIASLRPFFLPPFPFRFKRWEYHSDPPYSGAARGRPTTG